MPDKSNRHFAFANGKSKYRGGRRQEVDSASVEIDRYFRGLESDYRCTEGIFDERFRGEFRRISSIYQILRTPFAIEIRRLAITLWDIKDFANRA